MLISGAYSGAGGWWSFNKVNIVLKIEINRNLNAYCKTISYCDTSNELLPQEHKLPGSQTIKAH